MSHLTPEQEEAVSINDKRGAVRLNQILSVVVERNGWKARALEHKEAHEWLEKATEQGYKRCNFFADQARQQRDELADALRQMVALYGSSEYIAALLAAHDERKELERPNDGTISSSIITALFKNEGTAP